MIDEGIQFAIYAALKFILYGGWSAFGIKLFIGRQTRLLWWLKSLWFGGLKWIIGLLVGIVISFAIGSVSTEHARLLYFLIYIPVRAIEWRFIAYLIRNGNGDGRRNIKETVLWVLGGVMISYLSDLVSPFGEEDRFCIGRCFG